ncbi:hypothetical protein D3C76_1455660 [compost metagenome]
MGEEIITVSEIARFGLDQRRIGQHITVFVQQQNVALEARRSGTVEQYQMADLRRDLLEVVPLRGGDQALQGQVIKLDRAQHIGVDQLRDGGCTAGGRLMGVGVFADQQKGDDANNRNDRQAAAEDHQEFR